MKLSCDGCNQPFGLQVVEAPRISNQQAHEGSKFVSHMYQQSLTLSKYSWYLFLLKAESTPGTW